MKPLMNAVIKYAVVRLTIFSLGISCTLAYVKQKSTPGGDTKEV
jgi:hypothetical protein